MDLLPGYRNDELFDAFAGDPDALVEAGLSYDDASRVVHGEGYVEGGDWATQLAEQDDATTAGATNLLGIDVRPGVYVRLSDREQHIKRTYQAVRQLGLASRGASATTEDAAMQRISEAQGANADAYMRNVRGKTRERLWDARGAYMSGLGGVALHDELTLLGAWAAFRNAYAGPAGREQRDEYRRVLERTARQYNYELPKVS